MGGVSTLVIELSDSEVAELAQCEEAIDRGIRTFIEVGNALTRVRSGRLYRADHFTFEDYCRDRWGLRRKRAYDLIGAAKVVAELSPMGDNPAPANERQARELARVEPAQRAAVWSETVRATNGHPSLLEASEL